MITSRPDRSEESIGKGYNFPSVLHITTTKMCLVLSSSCSTSLANFLSRKSTLPELQSVCHQLYFIFYSFISFLIVYNPLSHFFPSPQPFPNLSLLPTAAASRGTNNWGVRGHLWSISYLPAHHPGSSTLRKFFCYFAPRSYQNSIVRQPILSFFLPEIILSLVLFPSSKLSFFQPRQIIFF